MAIDLANPTDLRPIAQLVRDVAVQPSPTARWLVGPSKPVTWVALIAGSFNPPTFAHLALVDAANDTGPDLAAFVVAVRSVDKEEVEAAAIEDRLALLAQIADRHGAAVAVTNAGLYVDQARAFRALLPAARLSFVVGYDKLVQILDPRYYDDRETALDTLFGLADLLVMPRDDQGPEEIATLLADVRHARWATHISLLPVPPTLDLRLSASAVRSGALDNRLADSVPPETIAFLRDYQPYQPARYAARLHWLRELLETGR